METEVCLNQQWQDIKTKLDDELEPAEFEELVFLLKKYNIFPALFKCLSELLDYLEMNMTESDGLFILKSVLAAMNISPEMETYSFVEMIEKYEDGRKQLGLNTEANFIGRKTILDTFLDKLSQSECQGIWIHGMGGFGKTTLAWELCYRLCKAKKDLTVIFVDLKQTTNINDLYSKILHHFRSPSTPIDITVLQKEIMFHIKNSRQDLCLVLDSIESIYTESKDKTDELIELLLEQGKQVKSQVKVIVTSRCGVVQECPSEKEELCLRFNGKIVEYQLGPLKPKHARTLMKRFCKPLLLTDDMCDLILERCGNAPLAIRLVSNNIRYSCANDFTSLYTIRRYLETWRHGLLVDPINYAFKGLDGKMQEYLQMLSVFQTSEFADANDVASVLGISRQEALVVLMNLSHRQLLQNVPEVSHSNLPRKETRVLPTVHTSGFKYSIHPLVNDFLLKEMGQDVQESIFSSRVRFCKCVLKKFDNFEEFEEKYEQVVQFVQNNTDLIKSFAHVLTDNDQVVDRVGMSPHQFHFLSRVMPIIYYTAERVTFFSKVAEHFQAMGRHESYLYWKLEEAICFVEDENLIRAEEMLTSIKDSCLNSDTSNSIKADFFLTKGRCSRRKRKCLEALDLLQKAKALLEACQPRDQYLPRIAYVLNAEGNVHHDTQNYEMAHVCHQKAKDITASIVKGGINTDLSVYTFNLGTIQRVRAHKLYESDKTGAKEMMRKALELFNESMTCDESLDLVRMPKYAEKLKQRSEVFLCLEDFQRAKEDAQKALDIQRNIHRECHAAVALAFYNLGRIYLKELDAVFMSKGSKETTELKKEARKSAVKYFTDAENQIVNGRLTFTDQQRRDFTFDYKIVAQLSMNDKFKKEVDEFCIEFEKGFVSSSSSSCDTESEPEEINTRSDSGISESISSAEVMSAHVRDSYSADNVFFHGAVPMQIEGEGEGVFECNKQKSKRKRSSSSSSLSE